MNENIYFEQVVSYEKHYEDKNDTAGTERSRLTLGLDHDPAVLEVRAVVQQPTVRVPIAALGRVDIAVVTRAPAHTLYGDMIDMETYYLVLQIS